MNQFPYIYVDLSDKSILIFGKDGGVIYDSLYPRKMNKDFCPIFYNSIFNAAKGLHFGLEEEKTPILQQKVKILSASFVFSIKALRIYPKEGEQKKSEEVELFAR